MRPRLRVLALISIVIGGFSCCSSKQPSMLNLFDPEARRLMRDHKEQEQDIRALSHFSYAQQLASEGNGMGAVNELKAALADDPDSAYIREVTADLLFQMEQKDEALDYARQAVKYGPERASAHALLGTMLLEKGDLDGARKSFETAASLDPDESEYVVNLANVLVMQSKPSDAIDVLIGYSEDHPSDIESVFYIGVIFQNMGQIDQALLNYRHVLSRNPSHYPTLYNVFELEIAKANFEKAVQTGRAILEYYPGDTNTRATMIDLLIHTGRDQEAMKVLDGGKSAGVPKPDWWLRKGYILLGRNEPEKALDEFEGALAVDPQSVEAIYAMGLAEASLENFLEAKSYFESIPREADLYIDARRQLALIALRQGDTDRALAIMEKIHKSAPDNPAVTVAYSAVLRDIGRVGEAAGLVEGLLKKMPKNQALIYERAMIYLAQDRPDAAIAVVEKILLTDPNNPQALNFIGYSLADQGVRLDEAESMIRRALEQEPTAGYIMDSLGWVYFQRGEYKKALEWLEKAIAHEGEDAEILEHIGDTYRALDNRSKARKIYKRALEITTSAPIRERIEAKLEDL